MGARGDSRSSNEEWPRLEVPPSLLPTTGSDAVVEQDPVIWDGSTTTECYCTGCRGPSDTMEGLIRRKYRPDLAIRGCTVCRRVDLESNWVESAEEIADEDAPRRDWPSIPTEMMPERGWGAIRQDKPVVWRPDEYVVRYCKDCGMRTTVMPGALQSKYDEDHREILACTLCDRVDYEAQWPESAPPKMDIFGRMPTQRRSGASGDRVISSTGRTSRTSGEPSSALYSAGERISIIGGATWRVGCLLMLGVPLVILIFLVVVALF